MRTPEERILRSTRALTLALTQAEAARAERNAAIREAAEAGLSLRRIAALTGISHQAVAKIVGGREEHGR